MTPLAVLHVLALDPPLRTLAALAILLGYLAVILGFLRGRPRPPFP